MPGLPGALFSKYKQYKDDSKTIVDWLADNARKCGYDPVQTLPPEKRAAKLKSRAKKLSRDTAAKENGQARASGNQTHIVKVREYEPMAQAIVNSQEPRVVIPLRILKCFRSCITARGGINKWYETIGTEESKKSDEAHGHFIETLKRTLQILVPAAKLQELDENRFKLAKQHTMVAEHIEDSTNRYTHLEIQDIDSATYEALGNASASQTEATKTPRAKYVPEEDDERSEWHFALQCFWEDMETLQLQLTSSWADYAKGVLDLTVAAVTTKTAIEMVKKAEEEFRKLKSPALFKDLTDGGLPYVWFVECCIRDGFNPSDMNVHGGNRNFFVPMVAWEQAKESYLLLHRLAVIYSNGTVPYARGADRVFAITRPAYYGSYNPELEFESLSSERQYEQITALLNDMFVTIGGWTVIGDSAPYDDMLMEGLSHIQRNQVEPPMWFLFACQNFLNIHFTLKTKSERPFEELHDFALAARRTLKDHQNFLTDHPMPTMRSAEDEEAVDGTLKEIEEWVLNDRMKQIVSAVPSIGTSRKQRIWQDFEFLRMSPALSGLWKLCFHIQLQWKGIILVNDTGLVAAAHLYNALYQNGYLRKPIKGEEPYDVVWQDMEYLLDLHRAEDTFMGARPQSIEACTKRLALVQGVAPQTFARRRRGNNHRVLRSRTGSKFLTPSTPVAKILGQMYLGGANVDWHLEQLDAIIKTKFVKDKADIVAYNEKMNTRLAGLDLTTPQGKMDALALFGGADGVANIIAEAKKISNEEATLYLRRIAAEDAISEAAFNCDWVRPIRAILNEFNEADAEKKREAQQNEDHAGNSTQTPSAGDTKETLTGGDGHDHGGLMTMHKSFLDSQHEPLNALAEVMDRWDRTHTLPLDLFIDIMRDSMEAEILDIQFDYFAFFRSVMSLLLKLQDALLDMLRPRLLDNADSRVREIIDQPEGAVCVIPQLAMLVACDPLNAPNILVLRPWVEVDSRPLEVAGAIMIPWLEEHGDEYCLSEHVREARRLENLRKEGPGVKYFDEGNVGEETPAERRHVGYSSSVGFIPGTNEKEMREIYDAMRFTGPMGKTVAETMAKLHSTKLTAEDRKGIEMRDQVLAKLKEGRDGGRGHFADVEASEDYNLDVD